MENTNTLSNTDLNTAGQQVNQPIMEECPVCYEEHLLTPMCPNNHKLCMVCLRHIQGIRNWQTQQASCPICRAAIPYVPIQQPQPQPQPWIPYIAAQPRQQQRRGHGRPRGQEWFDALTEFVNNKNAGRIPADAKFGGIHKRGCGNRECNRVGGSEGVRFLLYKDTGKRRYRCEECIDE